ncbi:PIG-L deacetylase family protein [Salinithrix halophila]|uniref:PIG-L deacetylase family protein n=1 Tax=Salinithrix halophila TaxID=1485204 RepID=A0ABV8JHC5_9BACL
MQTLLFAFAHPDDESFACGGTLARIHAEEKGRAILYCATRGEAGSPGSPPLCTKDELGDYRERELRRAATLLGIDEVFLRDFGDGQLSKIPLEQLTADLARLLDQVNPDAVITFPPHGISGHPDHRVIQAAVTKAVEASARAASIRLYRVVLPESANPVEGVHYTPVDEITHRVDVSPYRRVMMEALKAHQTQHASIAQVFPGVLKSQWEHLHRTEFFQSVHSWKSIPRGSLL